MFIVHDIHIWIINISVSHKNYATCLIWSCKSLVWEVVMFFRAAYPNIWPEFYIQSWVNIAVKYGEFFITPLPCTMHFHIDIYKHKKYSLLKNSEIINTK